MNMQDTSEPMNNPPASVNRRRAYARVAAGVFLLTVALFYAQENWRGRRAWQKCREKLEAQGKIIDWSRYIPEPVPDDQNIFKAPEISGFIKGRPGTDLTKHLGEATASLAKYATNRIVLAELAIAQAATNLTGDKEALRFSLVDPASRKHAFAAVSSALPPSATVASSPGLVFVSVRSNPAPPVRLLLDPEQPAGSNDLKKAFPDLSLEPNGANRFKVIRQGILPAGEYLNLTRGLEPDLAALRQALQRSYARMDSDYQRPFEIPTPNFVAIRSVAQTLAQRAQCFLLQTEPDKALKELTLMHQLRRMLGSVPNRPALTLVEAMISVAVDGLYVSVIQDGLRLHQWQEAQLVVFGDQLREIEQISLVKKSMNSEMAAVSRTFEKTRLTDVFKATQSDEKNAWLYDLLPRGWMYRNIAQYAELMGMLIDSLNAPPSQVVPRQIQAAGEVVEATISRFSPYIYLSRIAVPNCVRAFQRAAQNQTLVNQGRIACALERYRLTHRDLPIALDMLVPGFLPEIPQDPIGGGLPRYRRLSTDKFLLYSIGWSEEDHGGETSTNEMESDWVWNVNN